MRRRGRKRKAGRRHPSGDLVLVRESPALRARQMPHRKGLQHPEDARAETQLGRLALRGLIERAEELAGEEYRRCWRSYGAVLGGPRRLINGHARGGDCGGCLELVGTAFCECAARERDWLHANRALKDVGERAIVRFVVLEDQPCPRGYLNALVVGLRALARHFGLTPRGKVLLGKASSHLTPSTARAT